jgi:hypothetical protein
MKASQNNEQLKKIILVLWRVVVPIKGKNWNLKKKTIHECCLVVITVTCIEI